MNTRTLDTSELVLQEIHAERSRQITEEDYTAQYDDAHADGELALAAAAYAESAIDTMKTMGPQNAIPIPPTWPFEEQWFNKKTPREDLIRAGALIVAEIERLDRAAARATLAQDHGPSV